MQLGRSVSHNHAAGVPQATCTPAAAGAPLRAVVPAEVHGSQGSLLCSVDAAARPRPMVNWWLSTQPCEAEQQLDALVKVSACAPLVSSVFVAGALQPTVLGMPALHAGHVKCCKRHCVPSQQRANCAE